MKRRTKGLLVAGVLAGTLAAAPIAASADQDALEEELELIAPSDDEISNVGDDEDLGTVNWDEFVAELDAEVLEETEFEGGDASDW